MAGRAPTKATGLYYITHVENLPSLLERGILSHNRVAQEGIQSRKIYDSSIVERRGDKRVPGGESLWGFANLYFQPRNAMLFRVIAENSADSIAVVSVRPAILSREDIYIADGNAANDETEIHPAAEGRKRVTEIRRQADREFWSAETGSKRRLMAECLVPDHVDPSQIQEIYVGSPETANRVKGLLPGSGIPVIPEPAWFFKPDSKQALAGRLSLVRGDLFYSRLQTLTVSVNCVGVMGKGLASRAKYQFPDVYVVYQEVCRNRSLGMGQPYLYKREKSFEEELADDPRTFTNGNGGTWFLLFPTKNHWRERSDIKGIEAGLEWLSSSWSKEKITSLAIPALGCGLGRLEWKDVGPLMCRHLIKLGIDVWIYLPAEKSVPEEQLTKEFLLP